MFKNAESPFLCNTAVELEKRSDVASVDDFVRISSVGWVRWAGAASVSQLLRFDATSDTELVKRWTPGSENGVRCCGRIEII